MSPISGLFFLLGLTLYLSLIAVATADQNTSITATLIEQDKNTTSTDQNTPTTADASLITTACTDSPKQDLCLSLLNSHPDSTSADLKGLAFIALKAATKNATDTAVYIKLKLNDTELDPAVDDGLRNCDEVYGDIVDQIDDSVDALVSGAFKDLETWMKAAIADINTCDGSVMGQQGDGLEVSRRNQTLRQLCDVSLGIVHVLARTNNA